MVEEILSSIEFQMSLLLFVSLAGYLVASRINQSAVVGEILVGILVGPSVLGLITYTDFVAALAHLGAIFLLFTIGFEFCLADLTNPRYLGIAITAVTIAIGLALGLPLLHGIILAAAVLIGACCFSAIGMLLAVPPTNVPSNIMMLSSLIKFPLVFISGIFVPLEQLPVWGLVLAACSPLTYFTDLVRYAFTDVSYFPMVTDLAALAVFTLAFTAVTMMLHRRTMPRRM